MDDLDGFIDNIGNQITSLDDEISHAVQAQSAHGREATRVLKKNIDCYFICPYLLDI